MSAQQSRLCRFAVPVVFLVFFTARICSGLSSFPQGTILTSVAFGNGVFVAVGWDGAIFKSSDGGTWSECASNTKTDLSAVAFGNNRFVVVGWDGVILSSPDGVTWSKKNSKTTDNIWDLTFGGGLFVAVGFCFPQSIDDYHPVLTSTDGELWTNRSSGVVGTNIEHVTYGGGRFYAQGQIPLITSTDGITWSIDSLGWQLSLSQMTYGNGRWVALSSSESFAPSRICIKAGDSAWAKDSSTSVPWNELFGFANDHFIAIGSESYTLEGYTDRMWTSIDGITWTKQTAGTGIKGYGSTNAMAYGNGTFVLVGTNGFAAASSDGITWTSTTLQSRNNVLSPRLSNIMPAGLKIRIDYGAVSISAPVLNTSQPTTARLINAAGKIVFSASAVQEHGMAHFQIGKIPSGTYMLQLIDRNRIAVSALFPVVK
jgi:hypothetical protein